MSGLGNAVARVKCKSHRRWLSLGTGKCACLCARHVPELMQHVRDELVNTLCLANAVVRMRECVCVCVCGCFCVCACRIRFSHGSVELSGLQPQRLEHVHTAVSRAQVHGHAWETRCKMSATTWNSFVKHCSLNNCRDTSAIVCVPGARINCTGPCEDAKAMMRTHWCFTICVSS